MTRVIRMRRGPVAVVFEILFYLFNAVMALLLVATWLGAARVAGIAAERGAGAVVGAGLGGFAVIVTILFVWMAGDVILATLVLVSRGRRITIEDELD